MNKIYKVIWSKVKNSYVVVPEIAVSSSKNKGNMRKICAGCGFNGDAGLWRFCRQ